MKRLAGPTLCWLAGTEGSSRWAEVLLTLHDMDLHLPQGTTGPDLAQVWQQTPDPAAIVAQYDAGARALLFLRQVDNRDHVGRVVDINPTRQGNYLTHVGVRIDEHHFFSSTSKFIFLVKASEL